MLPWITVSQAKHTYTKKMHFKAITIGKHQHATLNVDSAEASLFANSGEAPQG